MELIATLVDVNETDHGLMDQPNPKYFTRPGTKYIPGCGNNLECFEFALHKTNSS